MVRENPCPIGGVSKAMRVTRPLIMTRISRRRSRSFQIRKQRDFPRVPLRKLRPAHPVTASTHISKLWSEMTGLQRLGPTI